MKPLMHVGIDVSAKTLEVATDNPKRRGGEFSNDAAGHKKLLSYLTKRGQRCRVTMEPSGIYHLDAALRLDDHDRIEVALANPRAVKAYGDATMKRGKSDPKDARLLVQYGKNTPFKPWQRPSLSSLQLRSLTRLIHQVVDQLRVQKQQLHAAKSSDATLPFVVEEHEAEAGRLKARLERLREAGVELVRKDPGLSRRFDLIMSIPGFAEVSGLAILGELCVLAEDMAAKQLVAHCGLDPINFTSGTSVRSRTRISKRGNARLRAALYMPTLVCVRVDRHVRAWYLRLAERKGSKKSAQLAVARKLLHCIHAMLANDVPWDGSRFSGLTLEAHAT